MRFLLSVWVVYYMLWYDFSIQKCIKKNIFYFTKIIFSQYLKSPFLGIFTKNLISKKNEYNAFVFNFLIIFYVSHFRAHYFIQSDVAGKYLIIVLLQDFYSSSISKNFSKKIFLGQLHWNLLLFQHSSSVLLSRSRWFRWL